MRVNNIIVVAVIQNNRLYECAYNNVYVVVKVSCHQ